MAQALLPSERGSGSVSESRDSLERGGHVAQIGPHLVDDLAGRPHEPAVRAQQSFLLPEVPDLLRASGQRRLNLRFLGDCLPYPGIFRPVHIRCRSRSVLHFVIRTCEYTLYNEMPAAAVWKQAAPNAPHAGRAPGTVRCRLPPEPLSSASSHAADVVPAGGMKSIKKN